MSRIPRGNSLNVEDILQRYGDVLETVNRELHESGVQTTPQPPTISDSINALLTYDQQSGAPLTPDDLTAFPPDVLGQLYSCWTAWANYYETLAGAAKARVEIIESKLEVVKAALTCYYREEEALVVDLISSKVLTDSRFVDWDVELAKAKMFFRGVEKQLATFKRTSNNISREQTRRSDDFNYSLRGGGGGSRNANAPAGWGRRD